MAEWILAADDDRVHLDKPCLGCSRDSAFDRVALAARKATLDRVGGNTQGSSELLVPLFHQFSVWQLFWVALLAGVGEELFFRVFVQGGLAIFFTYLNVPAASLTALFLASALFGVMHPITRTYAVLCMLAGLYLGAIWLWTGNLLVPILIHAIYDFFALCYLLRKSPRNPILNPDSAATEV